MNIIYLKTSNYKGTQKKQKGKFKIHHPSYDKPIPTTRSNASVKISKLSKVSISDGNTQRNCKVFHKNLRGFKKKTMLTS